MKNSVLISFAISSILITFLLFFIDEASFNFNWIFQFGNWIAFIIYVIPLILGQVAIYKLMPRRFRNTGNTILSILVGSFLGILLIVKVIFSHVV